MKISILYYSFLAVPLISSCTQNHKKEAPRASEQVSSTSCYRAVDGKDTVTMTLEKNGDKVTGKLTFNYLDKKIHKGDIKGEFKGDTLMVDYLSTIGEEKNYYRNPLAFLRKDGKLLMGVGKIETAWGRNYFKRNEPIDYQKGRFIFEEMSCSK